MKRFYHITFFHSLLLYATKTGDKCQPDELKSKQKNQMTSKGTNTKIVLLTTVDAVPPDPPSRPQPAPPPPPPPPEK